VIPTYLDPGLIDGNDGLSLPTPHWMHPDLFSRPSLMALCLSFVSLLSSDHPGITWIDLKSLKHLPKTLSSKNDRPVGKGKEHRIQLLLERGP